eukprot:TRINITY_DN12688_c0_g1_i1.p1 TRINITY_DN12688_c0_g1~~TRINITY_DN12688_c0_g1_i1.p1  ORF type:complete len:423 (-),score=79.11 TRINITY_DN12688_c0_g1_i1:68-1300(-)
MARGDSGPWTRPTILRCRRPILTALAGAIAVSLEACRWWAAGRCWTLANAAPRALALQSSIPGFAGHLGAPLQRHDLAVLTFAAKKLQQRGRALRRAESSAVSAEAAAGLASETRQLRSQLQLLTAEIKQLREALLPGFAPASPSSFRERGSAPAAGAAAAVGSQAGVSDAPAPPAAAPRVPPKKPPRPSMGSPSAAASSAAPQSASPPPLPPLPPRPAPSPAVQSTFPTAPSPVPEPAAPAAASPSSPAALPSFQELVGKTFAWCHFGTDRTGQISFEAQGRTGEMAPAWTLTNWKVTGEHEVTLLNAKGGNGHRLFFNAERTGFFCSQAGQRGYLQGRGYYSPDAAGAPKGPEEAGKSTGDAGEAPSSSDPTHATAMNDLMRRKLTSEEEDMLQGHFERIQRERGIIL